MNSKLIRTKILSRFPGKIGQKYQNKLINRKIYIETQRRFKQALNDCSGMTSIDIGANIGKYTTQMAYFSGQVFAFEPDPLAFNFLQQNTKNLKNVKIYDCAAGTENTTVPIYRSKKFHLNPELYTSSTSLYASSNHNSEDYLTVEQVDIIHFMENISTEIGVVKIDAEGAEVPILEGILKSKKLIKSIRFIFAEEHERLFPDLKFRYKEIYKQVSKIEQPLIDLTWH